jgi:multicomponent Na+:H+ antiporter subunit E
MRTVKTIVVLFAFWLIVAPARAWGDVAVGLVSATLIGHWAGRFLWAGTASAGLRATRLPGFALMLAGRIVVAAAQVLRIVFDPRLPVAPVMIRQAAPFRSEAARIAYAHAITITPGTLTVDVTGDTYHVHCLHERLAQGVLDGSLARHVARLFGEAPPS